MAETAIIRTVPSSSIDLNDDLKSILEPMIAKWQLAAARVAAGESDPANFPPATKNGGLTPEETLAIRFGGLPAAVRANASSRALRELGHAKTLTRAGNLLGLPAGPHGKVTFPQGSVSTTHAPVPGFKINAIDDMVREWKAKLNLPPAPPGPKQFHKNGLALQLVRTRCLDETNGFLGSEAGDDEIHLGGQAIDPLKIDTSKQDLGISAAATTINSFKVGDFSDGDVKDFQPVRVIHNFNLAGLDTYPTAYVVTLLMAEVDSGGFQDTLEKILNAVKDDAIAYLSASIGGAVGSTGGPVGAVIGIAVGYAVGKVFDYVSSLFDDVVFEPVTLELDIPSANAVIPTPSSIAEFKGPGHYQVRYEWKFS